MATKGKEWARSQNVFTAQKQAEQGACSTVYVYLEM